MHPPSQDPILKTPTPEVSCPRPLADHFFTDCDKTLPVHFTPQILIETLEDQVCELIGVHVGLPWTPTQLEHYLEQRWFN